LQKAIKIRKNSSSRSRSRLGDQKSKISNAQKEKFERGKEFAI